MSRLCGKITPPTELVLVTGGWCGDSFRCQCLDYNYLVMLVTTNSLPLDGTSSDLREVGNIRTGFFVKITLAQGDCNKWLGSCGQTEANLRDRPSRSREQEKAVHCSG